MVVVVYKIFFLIWKYSILIFCFKKMIANHLKASNDDVIVNNDD